MRNETRMSEKLNHSNIDVIAVLASCSFIVSY